MPVYLVTDTQCDLKMMVEADRPAGAIAALVQERFVVSTSLDATAALGLASDGIKFLRANRDFAQAEPAPAPAPEPEAQDTATTAEQVEPLPDDAPEFAEVEEYEAPARSSLDDIFADAEGDDDRADLEYLR